MRCTDESRESSTERYWKCELEVAKRELEEAEYALNKTKRRLEKCEKQVRLLNS